jgi:asparagine synthase (glutamine-hydrolysing)
MGAIVGTLLRSERPEPSRVLRMLAVSPHRGTSVSHHVCGTVVLGISNQPDLVEATISVEGDLCGVFVGSLDNVRELLTTLSHAGTRAASETPADVVVAAFRAFGLDAPNRMRGDFAAIVTDGRQLWLFRDHLGYRPLFFRDEPRGFFAGTEAKQVVAGAELTREPDLEVLEQIMYGRMPDEMPSALKGVSRLPKTTILTVGPEKAARPVTYWHPDRIVETAKISPSELPERFTELFKQAVARRLKGNDVVSLSGGIDSPAVAGFAAPLHRELTGKPLGALSAVFPDLPRVDERPYIETVTEYLGMTLHTCRLKARAWDDLESWCNLFDGPIPTTNTPQIVEFYQEARRLGFRNVLTGDIAECVFELQNHVTGHLLLRGRWRPLARLLSTQRRQGKPWRSLAAQLVHPLVPGSIALWYLSVRGLDFPKRIPLWLERRKVNERPYRNDLLVPARLRWSALQTLPLRGCPITLEAVDVCASLTGVTVGRPFGDVDFWEFFLSLPAEMKYPDLKSKTLLRTLLRGTVPDKILDRRDKTFFDDHAMSQIDYPLLRRYLLKPKYEMPGVNYRALASRLEREELNLIDLLWVNDLVRIHAFLNQW